MLTISVNAVVVGWGVMTVCDRGSANDLENDSMDTQDATCHNELADLLWSAH